MSMLGVFILTTAIGISTTRTPSSDAKDAYKALTKATYIQTGADKQAKNLERKYVPQYIKEYGGWITGTVKVIADRKISFEWTF